MPSAQSDIQQALGALAQTSASAHQAALAALPAIEKHGAQTALTWLGGCKRLCEFDADAGRAFAEASAGLEEVSESVLPWTEQALRFTGIPGGWHALRAFLLNVPAAYAVLGHAGERRWAGLGLAWSERHGESGRAYFETPVRDLAGRHGITGIEQLCQCFDELYQSRKLLPATYLYGALRVRNLLGARAVLPWALRGADILAAGRARGEAYFRLESEESLTLLMESMPGFRPMERSRLLGLLLAVWYGENFDLKDGTWSPDKGRPFIDSDGRSLFLPAVMADTDEAVLAVLHAAGHLVFGSYERDDVLAILAEAGCAAPPDDQPLSFAPVFARYGADALRFKLVFDVTEDLRIDALIARRVPNHLKRMVRAARAQGVPPEPAAAYYRLALDTLEFALGRDSALGTRERALLAPLTEPASSIVDAFRAARTLFEWLAPPPIDAEEGMQLAYLPGRSPNAARAFHPRSRSADSEEQQASGEQGDSEEQQQQGENEQGEDPQQTEAGQQDGDTAQEQTSGNAQTSSVGRARHAQDERKRRAAESGDKGTPYPEWDYREARHKRNWAWVQEKKLGESNLPEAQRLGNEYANTLKRLKQAIQAQKPTRLAPQRQQFDGDDIDLEAAVTYVTERHAGMSPKATLYSRREMKSRDVSVTLLADMSTSIMQLLPEGKGRLVDRVRAGILLFAESLEVVGDAYSIAGFCSKYRDNVSYFTIKDFDEPWTTDVKSLVGGMSGRLATRMGAAIRHATARFDQVSSRRRLLLILSDGRPEDYDDGGDRRYLHEDTRMAVKEAVAKGVHPFCITVDTLANEYLPQIFGPGHYLVLDHINSLPNKLSEIYLRLRR